MLAVDDREDQGHDGDLEQAGDDPRQPGPLRAVGVERGAREEQRGHQVREGDGVARRGEDRMRIEVVERRRLDAQRRVDREEDPREVQRQQQADAAERPHRLHAQQEGERRRALAAYVTPRQAQLGPLIGARGHRAVARGLWRALPGAGFHLDVADLHQLLPLPSTGVARPSSGVARGDMALKGWCAAAVSSRRPPTPRPLPPRWSGGAPPSAPPLAPIQALRAPA